MVNCGGIAEKNPLVMQIYADVTGRPMKVSRSAQTCAWARRSPARWSPGSAGGGYDNFAEAQKAMTGLKSKAFQPQPRRPTRSTSELYSLYRQLHDAFGTQHLERQLAPT